MTEMEHKLGGYKIFSREDAAALFAGRDVYIWGAGHKGRGFLGALQRNGFTAKAFLDTALAGTSYRGIPVLAPESIIGTPNTFILCATIRRKYLGMFATMEASGLVKDRDFTNIQTLCPYYPTIEVSGLCQLRCIACPRNGQNAHGGLMTLARYTGILDKLIREIPFLYLVEAYLWGDPLLNQQLPDIVLASNERGVQLGISTNLNYGQGIDALCRERPAAIHVAISGFGIGYELAHKGGRWDVVYENLQTLSRCVEKDADQDGRTLVNVMFHVHRRNVAEIPSAQRMCRELGFDFIPMRSQVFPDLVLDRLDGMPQSDDARLAMDLMPVDVDTCLTNARAEADKVCTNKRCIPVIDWDGSVLPCCNFTQKRVGGPIWKGQGSLLAGDFLKTPLSEIVERRKSCDLCKVCIGHSLHRYFNAADSQSIIGPLMGV